MGERTIKLLMSTVTGNNKIKKEQQHIFDVLSSKKINFTSVDISDAAFVADKTMMREKADKRGGQVPLPPQLFMDDEYIGDYQNFADALEFEELYQFLKLPVPKDEAKSPVVSEGKDD